jgi:hypothetical protein
MRKRQISILLVAAISLPGLGYSQPGPQESFAITAENVARTFSSKGIQTAGLQVSLLARVVATEPDPVMDVLSIEPRGKKQFAESNEASYMVKLGCHLNGVCLPFYAIVSKKDETAGSETMGSMVPLVPVNSTLKQGAAVTMRAGARARLVMDDGRSQVEVAVISLENGIAGHKIHVSSPDHKQVYLAEVVSSTLLTRNF